MNEGEKIVCQICSSEVHAIKRHIEDTPQHLSDGWTIERYKKEYPDSPVISATVRDIIKKQKMEKHTKAVVGDDTTRLPLHEVFSLGAAPDAMTPTGNAINITVFGKHDHPEMVPDVDLNYVFDINLTKIILMGLEGGMPVYLWGHSGTGKTSAFDQVCAHTNRPVIRVQHTLNTEESMILGHPQLKGKIGADGSTYTETSFKPGPLALAMKYGWVYLADEYDFGVPHVLSVYQPVLEGKALIIKEAEGEWRRVDPHPNFRFVATGNTNGVGDETGLYQGTQLQNAANYERFAIVEKVLYMASEMEELVLQSQASLHKKDAVNMVKYATKIREAVERSEMSMPISPRALIHASKIGTMRGCFKKGLMLAYINRLSEIDREAATQLAQRIFV